MTLNLLIFDGLVACFNPDVSYIPNMFFFNKSGTLTVELGHLQQCDELEFCFNHSNHLLNLFSQWSFNYN